MSLLSVNHLEQLLDIGGKELIDELINIYLNEVPNYKTQLTALDINAQQKELGQIAHKLKSSTASLGLVIFSKKCEEIEANIRSGRTVGTTELQTILGYLEEAQTELIQYKNNH